MGEPLSWARVDLIETARDGTLKLTPRFLSLEGRRYVALPMPPRVREYAGCEATP